MMGLDCSHDAFFGAYSAFHRLRKAIANAADVSYPPHDDEELDNKRWYWKDNAVRRKGIEIFLSHSDSLGELSVSECKLIADDLEMIIDKVEEKDGDGHLARQGGMRESVIKFAAGCRRAIAANEPLLFR